MRLPFVLLIATSLAVLAPAPILATTQQQYTCPKVSNPSLHTTCNVASPTQSTDCIGKCCIQNGHCYGNCQTSFGLNTQRTCTGQNSICGMLIVCTPVERSCGPTGCVGRLTCLKGENNCAGYKNNQLCIYTSSTVFTLCNGPYYSSSSTGAQSYIVGDPQFVGLRGQNFQIHGVSGEVYNIVSDNDLQYNSRFVFLDQGECPVVSGKKQKGCFSHPGSYLGELGLKSRFGDRIRYLAGAAADGFAAVEVNGRQVEAGETVQLAGNAGFISLNTTHLSTIQVGSWNFDFENSDMFINQRVAVAQPSKLKSHGLLGQTWRQETYSGPIKYIQGEVDDYVIRSKEVFGDDFVYNTFN